MAECMQTCDCFCPQMTHLFPSHSAPVTAVLPKKKQKKKKLSTQCNNCVTSRHAN